MECTTIPGRGWELRLWLPDDYEVDKRVAHRFVRRPEPGVPNSVEVRLDLRNEKQAEPPAAPQLADLMKADPTLTEVKFTTAAEPWRGRPIAVARYEAFVQKKGWVFGRMAWLPMEPGTVVLNLNAVAALNTMMTQDWDSILATIEGPMTTLTFRERAPGRWKAMMIVGSAGILLMGIGVVMILARMTEALGGGVVSLGLLVPVVPVGYGILHFQECWRGLLVIAVGAGTLGVALSMRL
jgi:hypothetical protein